MKIFAVRIGNDLDYEDYCHETVIVVAKDQEQAEKISITKPYRYGDLSTVENVQQIKSVKTHLKRPRILTQL